MGEARRRMKAEGDEVLFEYSSVASIISKRDRDGGVGLPIGAEEDPPEVRVVKHTLMVVVDRVFPQGMDPHDRRVWAAWQDVFDDPDQHPKVTRGMVDWLRKHVTGDVKTPPVLARYHEALCEYLNQTAATPHD